MLKNLVVHSPLSSFLNMDFDRFDVPSLRNMVEMRVDILENEKEFSIHADVPGVKKENINIDFKDGLLTISVEEQSKKEQKDGEKFLRLERSYNKKSRTFGFEVPIDEEAIVAKYEEGVLILTLPKKTPVSQTKKIMIN